MFVFKLLKKAWHWTRNGKPAAGSCPGRRRPCVLFLELLEKRDAPSITTLTVQNDQPFARIGEPVTSGVPIPESMRLYDTSHLRILDSNNIEVPAQFAVEGRWGTGPQDASKPIEWLQVHFAVSLGPQSSTVYHLNDDGTGNAAPALSASQSGAAITISTGPARFQINRQSFSLFDSVWLDLNGDGVFDNGEQIVSSHAGDGSFVKQLGLEYRSTATAPLSAVLVENGPLEAIVRVEGFHQNGAGQDQLLRYVTYLTFYAGASYVKVDQTLIEGREPNGPNADFDRQQQTNIDEAGLRVQLNLTGIPQASIRADNDTVSTFALAGGDTAELVQHRLTDWHNPLSFEVTVNGDGQASGQQATRAWLDLSDGRWGLAVGTHYFWQKNPEALLARGDGTVQVEFPAEAYTIFQAMGLEEETVFYFHGASTPAAMQPVLEGLAKDPLLAAAPASWMVQSGAFGNLPPAPAPTAFRQVDQVFTDSYQATMDYIRQGHSYGLLNYLDMPSDLYDAAANPDQVGWGNSYYDAPGAEISEFARTGDIRWLRDLAFPQAQHYYTTDMYDPDNPNSYSNGISGARGPYHRDAWTGEYNYMESLWQYYYLSGDPHALERGHQQALTYANNPTWAVSFDLGLDTGPGLTTRMTAQKFTSMLQGYLATGDVTLKSALDAQMRDFLTHEYTPEGFVVGGYSHNASSYDAEQGWMVTLLIHDAVSHYYQLTGDALARDFVVTTPQRVAQYYRVSSEPHSVDYFRFYNNVHVNVLEPGRFTVDTSTLDQSDPYFYVPEKLSLANALARAYEVSGDTAVLTAARELFLAVLPDLGGSVFDKPGAKTTLRLLQTLAILAGNPSAAIPPAGNGVPANLRACANIFTHSQEYYANIVADAYRRHLGRTPDQAGLAAWLSALEHGLTDEWLDAGFLGSAEYLANHGGAGQSWIQGLYLDLLGRPADAPGLAAWLSALAHGLAPSTIAYGFAASAERAGQRIAADYQIYLGRPPESTEVVDQWVKAFLSGASNENAVAGFVGSAEYFQKSAKGGGAVNGWIASVYADVLHRGLNAAELAAWAAVVGRA